MAEIKYFKANRILTRKMTDGDPCSKVTVMPEIDVYSCREQDSTSTHLIQMNGTPCRLPIKLDRRVITWSLIAAQTPCRYMTCRWKARRDRRVNKLGKF